MLAIGTYIKLLKADGTDAGYNFQNFHYGENRNYNGSNYMYGAFGFSGGTVDLEAANIDASLVFAVNALALSVFQEAVNSRWLIVIRTVWLDPDTLEEGRTYGEETYAITGLEHDSSRLSVRLGSPLDAVAQNAPRRVLTQKLVGALPSTGNINLN
jgi:hypothetical protein